MLSIFPITSALLQKFQDWSSSSGLKKFLKQTAVDDDDDDDVGDVGRRLD